MECLAVAVQSRHTTVTVAPPALVVVAEAPFFHLLVQRGEKQVLQHCLVVGTDICGKVLEHLPHCMAAEEIPWHESLFLKEPAKDQARDQPDNKQGSLLFGFDIPR